MYARVVFESDGLVGRVFTNDLGDWIQSPVESYQRL